MPRIENNRKLWEKALLPALSQVAKKALFPIAIIIYTLILSLITFGLLVMGGALVGPKRRGQKKGRAVVLQPVRPSSSS